MRAPIIAALLAAASLAAGPLAAQAGPAATPRAATRWGPKPAGTFNIVAEADGLPHPATLVMTTDSAGHSRAVVTAEGEAHEMTVTVTDPDLVLATDTPRGTMTITIQRHGDAITGSFSRGMDGGTITGSRAP